MRDHMFQVHGQLHSGLGGTEIPNSTEFRFKAASASNMTIVQGGGNSGNNWGISSKR